MVNLTELDFQKAAALTAGDVDGLWANYDKDANGILDSAEISKLVDDIFTVLATEKGELLASVASLFAGEDEEHKEHIGGQVQAFFDFTKKEIEHVKKEIAGVFDTNQDGKVDKLEFTTNFARYLAIKLHSFLAKDKHIRGLAPVLADEHGKVKVSDLAFAEVSALTQVHIAKIWNNYANGADSLSGEAVENLVGDLFTVLAEDAAGTSESIVALFGGDEKHEEAAEKIGAYLATLNKDKKAVVTEALEALDTNKDGKITQLEFQNQFGRYISQKIRALLGLPLPAHHVHEHRFVYQPIAKFSDLSFDQAANLTEVQTIAIWNAYDKNNNGKLSKVEVKALVKDLLLVLAKEEANLVQSVGALFASEEEGKAHEGEIKTRVGVFLHVLEAKSDALAREILGRFDINKDGSITREEFLVYFKTWVSKKLRQLLSGA